MWERCLLNEIDHTEQIECFFDGGCGSAVVGARYRMAERGVAAKLKR